MIAGKSVVAFRREEPDERSSSKCFGFVQTYDEKPRRRLWELLKSQGMRENQQIVFLSDGGDTVRQLQEYLHPCSEHLIDWFHITMRLTVLQQQAKGLQTERPQFGQETSRQLESVKHLLWHGNTEEALETHSRPEYRPRSPSSVLTRSRQTWQEPRRVRDLHPKQHRLHPELRGTLPSGRND